MRIFPGNDITSFVIESSPAFAYVVRGQTMRIKKVIVVINRTKQHAKQTASTLKKALDDCDVQQEWLDALPPGRHTIASLDNAPALSADLVMACGGDGTLLQTAHRFRGSGIPILGINIGYMGFITSVEGQDVPKEMRRILAGEFIVSERTALDLTVHTAGAKPVTGWALNDAVITRGANPHLISLRSKIGSRPLMDYRCDGLIVSTPTGSTAYSLAAGGPIISPECNVLLITPICAQSLTNRSVIINSTETIEMSLAAGSGNGMVQVDGMDLAQVTHDSSLLVRTSSSRVPIAFLPEINYYDILGRKLCWTGDMEGRKG
jgi:NAD+ kinase